MLGLVSVLGNVPMIVLVIVGSVAGAVGVTGGLMLLVGSLNTADFSRGDFADTVSNSFGWTLLLLVLAVGGIVIQAAQRALMRQNIREVWYVESTDSTHHGALTPERFGDQPPLPYGRVMISSQWPSGPSQ